MADFGTERNTAKLLSMSFIMSCNIELYISLGGCKILSFEKRNIKLKRIVCFNLEPNYE